MIMPDSPGPPISFSRASTEPRSRAASARIIVLERDNAGRGTYGEIDATGEIQRMVMNPVFPEGFRDWSCE